MAPRAGHRSAWGPDAVGAPPGPSPALPAHAAIMVRGSRLAARGSRLALSADSAHAADAGRETDRLDEVCQHRSQIGRYALRKCAPHVREDIDER